MPKGSEDMSNARKEEIIDACASLYETKSFRDITIRDIGEKTSFTRTSIYNYYHSKEEIFLALLRREHEAWTEDLNGISRQYGKLSAEEFADKLARSLEKRGMYAQTDVHEHLRYGGQQPSGKSGGLQKVLCKRAAGCHVLPGKVFPLHDGRQYSGIFVCPVSVSVRRLSVYIPYRKTDPSHEDGACPFYQPFHL